MSKKEDRQTVFRRIGGRIVPITVGSGISYKASKIDQHGVRGLKYGSFMAGLGLIGYGILKKNKQ